MRWRPIDPDLSHFEGLLSSKATSYAGAAVVVPLLLFMALNGSITFESRRHAAPEIQRMLAPPPVRTERELVFERTAPEERTERLDIKAFEAERRHREDTPRLEVLLGDDAGARAATQRRDDRRVPDLRVDETPSAGRAGTTASAPADVDLPPGSGLVDRAPGVGAAGTAGPALRRGAVAGAGRRGAGVDAGAGASGAPGAAGGDRGTVQALADRGAGNATPGVRQAPITPARGRVVAGEKRDLIDWIAAHREPLSAAVAAALEYDPLKKDATARTVFAAADGHAYQVYLLHRRENDLVRLLVVRGDRAWRVDLPERDLITSQVLAGRVERADFGGGTVDQPAPIIEVSLQAVTEVPAEARDALALVRGWLRDESGGGR